MVKFHIPINDALHWKLRKNQTLHNALINYGCFELGVSSRGESDSAVYVQGGDFIVEIEVTTDKSIDI